MIILSDLVQHWILIVSFVWTVVVVHGCFFTWTLLCGGYHPFGLVFYHQLCNCSRHISYFHVRYCNQSGCACRYGASLGGPLCHTHNPILRLFSRTCLHTTSDDDQMRPHKKHKQHDKQHHHGGGAARPSSGVDLMNPCRPSSGRPSAYFFQYRCRSDLIDSIN